MQAWKCSVLGENEATSFVYWKETGEKGKGIIKVQNDNFKVIKYVYIGWSCLEVLQADILVVWTNKINLLYVEFLIHNK